LKDVKLDGHTIEHIYPPRTNSSFNYTAR